MHIQFSVSRTSQCPLVGLMLVVLIARDIPSELSIDEIVGIRRRSDRVTLHSDQVRGLTAEKLRTFHHCATLDAPTHIHAHQALYSLPVLLVSSSNRW